MSNFTADWIVSGGTLEIADGGALGNASVVTVNNGKGVLAKVASALAAAEVDIIQVNMADESPQGAIDIKFIIAVHDVHQLDQALRNLRHSPVVLKAQASELPHKSDVGGVLVGLADEAALRAGWNQLFASVKHHRPELVLEGALVEAMGPRGLELVVGAKRDADWGPVVLVGLGGIWIEALKDVRLIPADMAEADIAVELTRLKAAVVLQGIRGAAAVDMNSIPHLPSLLVTP